eukprot:TRINITY_DN773_c0_g1_i5.p1 TRINITY_DN773_c0_g1~~TRINITY_DN773_c0_g1_i5.p1  ORF type:complete len:210 (-),score=-6.80 TRINITY_DN773_c0_g1_i5:1116-1745(-)
MLANDIQIMSFTSYSLNKVIIIPVSNKQTNNQITSQSLVNDNFFFQIFKFHCRDLKYESGFSKFEFLLIRNFPGELACSQGFLLFRKQNDVINQQYFLYSCLYFCDKFGLIVVFLFFLCLFCFHSTYHFRSNESNVIEHLKILLFQNGKWQLNYRVFFNIKYIINFVGCDQQQVINNVIFILFLQIREITIGNTVFVYFRCYKKQCLLE